MLCLNMLWTNEQTIFSVSVYDSNILKFACSSPFRIMWNSITCFHCLAMKSYVIHISSYSWYKLTSQFDSNFWFNVNESLELQNWYYELFWRNGKQIILLGFYFDSLSHTAGKIYCSIIFQKCYKWLKFYASFLLCVHNDNDNFCHICLRFW